MRYPTASPDFAAIKQREQQVWGDGDYAAVAVPLDPTAEILCEDAGFSGGERILDVSATAGNVTLAAARRHAGVIGIDYVPSLLVQAGERAAADERAVQSLHRLRRRRSRVDEVVHDAVRSAGVEPYGLGVPVRLSESHQLHHDSLIPQFAPPPRARAARIEIAGCAVFIA